MLGVLGAGFFLAYRERLRGRRHLWSYVVGGACVVVLLLMVWEPNLYSAFSWDVAYAVPAAVLIVGLALSEKSIVARVLRSRAFVTLGELSYCFYLLHVPLGALKGGATASQPWTQVAYYFVFLFMVVALSHGVHRLVERPAQRWIRQAYAALAQRPSRAIAPADRIVR
jgi:peptidoglycan/LPS O-acetylase OafA/YrhL